MNEMTNMATKAALTVLIVLATTPAALGESLDHSVVFDEADLLVTRIDGMDVVRMSGCDITREPGLPELPVRALTLSLPAGARVTSVEVLSAESIELLGRFVPQPAQLPRILPIPGIDLAAPPVVGPDPKVYGGRKPYPRAVVELAGSGRMGSNTLVGLRVYPVQFVPAAGRLRLFRTVTLRVEYEPAARPSGKAAGRQLTAIARLLSDNTVPGAASGGVRRSGSRLDAGDFEHVILVPNSGLEAAVQPLADWKTRKGVPSKIVYASWVLAAYPGADDPERIRNFIADARDTWGATWFLIVGDTDDIPTRRAYAMTCEAGGHPDEDAIGCDGYYADLDGNWNADGDDIYGELSDDVDLYPDVFVGRVPIRSVEDAEAFVAKLIEYERAPESGFALDMLMAAEVLWSDPFTDSGIGLNRIDRDYVPPRYDPITKLYETLGNESGESVKAAINDGPAHFLHSGHAWYTVMGCGDGSLYRWEVLDLTNAHRQPLVYSIGCWASAFDIDEACIAERFLQNPGGGAVAFIGNSRYGWASPGNPGYGYSERFMQEFYRLLFVEHVKSAGAALAAAKAHFIPFSQAENVYRWHQYQLNLLGDPEMPVWTGEPAALVVSHPDSLVPGPSVLDVTVWSAGAPVEDALVCATNGGDVYSRGTTASDGSVTLDVDTVLPDDVNITVTAPDCRPYEGSIPVVFSGAFVRTESFSTDDSAGGNGDGLPGPGETVELSLRLMNFGNEIARSVEASLSSTDPLLTVLSGPVYYGDIGGGAAVDGASAFTVDISPDCSDGRVALLDVQITSGVSRAVWTGRLSLTISAPVLEARSYSIDDGLGGDGDGIADPGEEVRLMIEVANLGGADAIAPVFMLSCDEPGVEVTAGTASLPVLASDDTGNVVFVVSVAADFQEPGFPELLLNASTSDGLTSSTTVRMAVGGSGLAFDFEAGTAGWTHGGTADSWGLTSHRSHSGSMSWYVGQEGSWLYADSSEEWLDSPTFVRGPGAELSFWCWYEFPIYHEDGFFVEVTRNGAPIDTLDFIGSGGALDVLGSIGNDWLEYRYALPGEVGDTLAIRFRFTSDETDVAEGVYVDDMVVGCTDQPAESGADSSPADEPLLLLHQNRPNPFSPSTNISFTLTVGAEVELAVYNIQGRLIRTLVSGMVPAGEHEVEWNGTDEFGVDVAAGVYLYRLRHGETEETRKMILVR